MRERFLPTIPPGRRAAVSVNQRPGGRSGLLVALLLAGSLRAGAAADDVRVLPDVAYLEPGRTERLDVYLPVGRREETRSPALVWIHGGGWMGGTKNEQRAKNVCSTLARAGYVAVSIDYRLGHGAWPTNLFDAKNAVRFLRVRAAEYGVDPERIAVAGGSAGGHLALMVGLTGASADLEPTAPYPGVSSAVRCILNFYGPTNILTRQETDKAGVPTGKVREVTGAMKVFNAKSPQDEVLRIGSPVTHLKASSPPILTLHGKADATVDHLQALELEGVARERGARHELILLEGVGHTFDLQTWAKKPLPRDLRPVVLAYLEQHLGLPPR